MSRVKMTSATYKKFKDLSDLKDKNGKRVLTPQQIVDILGGSTATVGRVRQSSDYSGYKLILAENHKIKEVKAPPKIKDLLSSGTTTTPVIDEHLALPKGVDIDKKLDTIIKMLTEQAETNIRMNESLTWISEHAIIKTTKNRRFF